MIGIPLRAHPLLASVGNVWPFETGLEPLGTRETVGLLVLFAEIYPFIPPRGDAAEGGKGRGAGQYYCLPLRDPR
jgi:hypothetical protein